jgi:hypothetical protein
VAVAETVAVAAIETVTVIETATVTVVVIETAVATGPDARSFRSRRTSNEGSDHRAGGVITLHAYP